MAPDPLSNPEQSDIEIVLDAAERHYRELLNQASNYEKLGIPAVVREYQRDYLRPLRAAINSVKEDSRS